MQRNLTLLWLMVLATGAACSAVAAPTAPPAPTNTPTATTAPPLTPTASATATLTPAPTDTATVTPTPTVTLTPSVTPPPSSTPGEVASFTLDNWEILSVPGYVESGLSQPHIAFLNLNNRDTEGSVLTPQPGTGVQTLYFTPPVNRVQRFEVLTIPESTGDRVYIAPNGLGVAYFVEPGESKGAGLYVLDIAAGTDARVLPVTSLVQRGFVSEPVWNSAGDRFAITLATPYATDIYIVSRTGTPGPINATQSGAYDRFPAFSPDGRYLAFVSDREPCPTWVPQQPDTCDRTGTPPPDGGHLHILDFVTNEITKISDVWITETNAPRWINATQVAFAQGDPLFGDAERSLWVADVPTGTAREIVPNSATNPLMLSEAWSPNGTRVVYQSAGSTTELVMANLSGDVVARLDELNYPRYGVAASWAPDGSSIAVGGVNGQCPFGSTVLDASLSFLAQGNPPPSMCNPQYAPDGSYIAFLGVSLNNFDGRADVYTTNANGFGAVNLTGDLRGTMTLLGWIDTNVDG